MRQLVELHRGTVAAESSGRNAGTTFRVMLPLPSHHEVPNATEKTGPTNEQYSPITAQHPLSGLRVLVVDDEYDTRELVAAVLTTCGAEVVSVGFATEALEQMERQRFDLLISDIGMPEMSGYDLIGKIRQLAEEQGGRTPAVALTAYAGIDHRNPYPYILLNLFLSMLAAVQAPVILMSQNRQGVRDRLDAAHDYEVNLKAELEILSLQLEETVCECYRVVKDEFDRLMG